MSWRHAFVTLATVAVAINALAAGQSAAAQPRPSAGAPNIVFIMADDHTSQAWGCYGSRLAEYCETPNIDRLAVEGARLTNCFCTNSICVPSRAAILTGQYSHANNDDVINKLKVRLAELQREVGDRP